MKIKTVYINNFRSIAEQTFNLKDLSILIGDNGTGKTTVLEAINFALSPYFISGKIQYTDFNNGTDKPIIIQLLFDTYFEIEIPDGYTTQIIMCDKIHLEIKKREKATANKAFSDGFVTNHYVIPASIERTSKGWSMQRKSGKNFDFTERSLSISSVGIVNLPKCFYFGKNREMQIKKGYNSSISSVFDDFNWRFEKSIKRKDITTVDDSFMTKKNSIEEEIISNVDETALKKSFETLNEKLHNFGIEELKLSFINSNAPFDNAFLSNQTCSLDMPISNLGSGIEMIVSLLFLETLSALSKDNIIILIDEPELHLHPHLQERLVLYLQQLIDKEQIVITTHSPYFFKNCHSSNNLEMIVTRKSKEGCSVNNSDLFLKTFPWSPSWGEVNFYAYDLPTIEFHNELYGYLQEQSQLNQMDAFDNYLSENKIMKIKEWKRVKADKSITTSQVTLPTYIRNYIHHPENTSNELYSTLELRESIILLHDLTKLISKSEI